MLWWDGEVLKKIRRRMKVSWQIYMIGDNDSA